jgi:hypothetical protein
MDPETFEYMALTETDGSAVGNWRIPKVVDSNHVWFTALCFNVLKERA